MAVTVEDKPHAVLGPSGWDRWSVCPGSVPLTEHLDGESSRYAREGTAAHSLLEDCLKGGFDAEDLIGREYIVEGELFVVDMEMADAVNTALGWIKTEIDEARGDILLVEQQVPIGHLTGETDAVGSSDVIGLVDGGKTLVVMDYKHGKGVQVYASTKENEDGKRDPNGQMAMYGLGSFHMMSPFYEDIERIKLFVLQPRIDWHDSFELTVEELLAFGDVVTEAAGRVELNRAVHAEGNSLDLVPSDKGCKFCRARHFCPALASVTTNALAVTSTADDFEDLTLPKKASAAVAPAEDISNEKLAEIVRAEPLIETYLKAARAELERRLLDGQTVPGFYLGEGKKGNRAWRDEKEAEALLVKRLKVSGAYERKVLSPSKAEKALKAKPKQWAELAALITQAPGKPSVCREGDPNPPAKLVADASDFEDLTALENQPTVEAPIDPFG